MAKQFLSAISCYPGTVGSPGLYLGSDTTTGFYRIGANNIGVAISGSKVLDVSSTGLGITGKLKVGSMREAVIQTGNNGGALVNGLKIKTNIPGGSGFWNDNTTTLWIEGYDYRTASVFNVAISWYGYSGGNTFFNQTITSYGGIAPTATLSIESGKVVINFAINTGGFTDYYYGYLTVRSYDLVNADSAYAGWSIADEAVTGTQSVTLTYKNRFQNVILDGNLTINGTTKTAGYFYAGSTSPTNVNRLNYDGYLYATRFYGDGSQLTGVTTAPSGDIYAFAAAYG